jgi:hypothetical protein
MVGIPDEPGKWKKEEASEEEVLALKFPPTVVVVRRGDEAMRDRYGAAE